MRTIELFSGTKSFSKVAKDRGHSTFTVEIDPELEPDWCGDIRYFGKLGDHPPESMIRDVVWASPPCTAFSVASLGHHWGGGFRAYVPKTDGARLGVELVKRTLDIIREIKPRYWFIENPRGVLRKLPFMDEVLSRDGGAQGYGFLLSVFRYPTEDDRHLAQLPVDSQTQVQERRPMPRSRSPWIKNRYTRTERS